MSEAKPLSAERLKGNIREGPQELKGKRKTHKHLQGHKWHKRPKATNHMITIARVGQSVQSALIALAAIFFGS